MAVAGRSIVSLVWRVVVITVGYAVVAQLLGALSGPRPALSASYAGTAAISLVTGAAYALVLLPLARRLPYRFGARFLALFLPLYWIGVASNLVEAAVNTSLPRAELIGGAVIFAIPSAVAASMIAWLLPAVPPRGPVKGILATLRERPWWSWSWRIVACGILFAGLLEVFGIAWGPLIARYYNQGQDVAQVHTVIAAGYVVWPEEFLRGVVFVLVLLPVLAVMRGRGRRDLLRLAAYVALIDAVLESWLAMLSMTSYPLGFRIGEGLDLTTDAIARGIFVAVLLALPAALTLRAEDALIRGGGPAQVPKTP